MEAGDDSAVNIDRLELVDKIKGMIFGACIGDAIGLSTEFMTKEEAWARYPSVDIKKELCKKQDSHGCSSTLEYHMFFDDFHRSKWDRGDWTDDCDQMILILQSLLENDLEVLPTDFAVRLLTWMNCGFPELGDKSGHGMGFTVASVMDHDEFLHDPHKAAREVWMEKGCVLAANGAAMRTAVLGVPRFWDVSLVARDAKNIAAVTHADPRSIASSVAITTAIALMLQGKHRSTDGVTDVESVTLEALSVALKELIPVSKDPSLSGKPSKWACNRCTYENEPMSTTCAMCGYVPGPDEKQNVHVGFGVSWTKETADARSYDAERASVELSEHMLATQLSDLKLDEDGVIGYTYKSVGAGFYALRHSAGKTFRSALMEIVMEAGDADSNAVVAGALLGCLWGYQSLTTSWLEGLIHKKWLEPQVDAFVEAVLSRAPK